MDTHRNMRTALWKLFEISIHHAYHSGVMTNTGMAMRGFGNKKPTSALELPMRLYGKPSLQELDQALFSLHEPMYHNQPVEVMLRTTDELQILLMEYTYGDCELDDVNIISYAMIKLSKCGGLYTKAIEWWQINTK